MLIAIVFGIFSYFSNKKFTGFGQLFMVVAGYFIIYFQNRLLYSMCQPTLKREGFVEGNSGSSSKPKNSNSNTNSSDPSNVTTTLTSMMSK